MSLRKAGEWDVLREGDLCQSWGGGRHDCNWGKGGENRVILSGLFVDCCHGR